FSTRIQQHLRRRAPYCHDAVLPAVVIQIAESRASSGPWDVRTGICSLKTSLVIHGQQRQFFILQRGIDLLYVIEHVALRDEKIFPSVVVEVFEADAPPRA